MTRKGERITINRLRFVRRPGNLLVTWLVSELSEPGLRSRFGGVCFEKRTRGVGFEISMISGVGRYRYWELVKRGKVRTFCTSCDVVCKQLLRQSCDFGN